MKIAAIQMTSGPDRSANLQQAESLIRQAAEAGCRFIATPEVTDQIIAKRGEHLDQHFAQETHPALPVFAQLAKECNIHLLIGSICIRLDNNKLANRSFLFTPTGTLAETYDKIHLFDVDLPNGDTYRESDTFSAGTEAVITALDNMSLGLSICYDVRFPHLYRFLAQNGADILTIPSAFTVPTGEAHWHSLLRARAIETGSYVIAPAQIGDHAGIRQTYGHSLIISPWGDILAEAKEQAPCIITATIDPDRVTKARQAIPAWQVPSQEFPLRKGS